MIKRAQQNFTMNMSQNFNPSVFEETTLFIFQKLTIQMNKSYHEALAERRDIERNSDKQKENRNQNKNEFKGNKHKLEPKPDDLEVDSSLMNKLKHEVKKIDVSRSGKLTEEKTRAILNDLMVKYDYKTINEAATVIAYFCQSGGATKNCDGNFECNLFDKTVKLSFIRRILKNNKETGNLRKLACSMDSFIIEVCIKLELPGNLCKKILSMHPEESFSIEQIVYMSDFQLNNPNIPTHIRK